MSEATGAKKPSESQQAKALWAMMAAKDRGEEYFAKKIPPISAEWPIIVRGGQQFFFAIVLLISHVSFVVIRLTSHLQLDMSQSIPNVERVLSWRRVSCEQQLDSFQSSCQV